MCTERDRCTIIQPVNCIHGSILVGRFLAVCDRRDIGDTRFSRKWALAECDLIGTIIVQNCRNSIVWHSW